VAPLRIFNGGKSEEMKRREINASDGPQPSMGAYSQAVELIDAKRIVFVSGQIPMTADNKVPEGFEAQAREAWANLIAQLHAADMTLDNLVKVTLFLSDRKYIPEYRRVRGEVLAGRQIALTTIVTGIFDEAWLLEIEGIAAA
jgi:enamine deaminase RidA (YjgF/YER057c/UK114 family)